MKYLIFVLLVLSGCGQPSTANPPPTLQIPCPNSKLISTNIKVIGLGSDNTIFSMNNYCAFELIDITTGCYLSGVLHDENQGSTQGQLSFQVTFKGCDSYVLPETTYNYDIDNVLTLN